MAVELTAAQFRSRFPGLQTTTYLASCSQGALSDDLVAALTEFQVSMLQADNPWDQWVHKVDEARLRFAQLIGAGTDEVAILSCASEGAYQIASGQAWQARRSILTCDLEFPSIAHVWLAQRARGAQLRFTCPSTDGFVRAEDYAAAIDEDCALVSVPLITYRHGQRLAVTEIAELAHQHGARVFVDAYQGVGVDPVDVTQLRCDYLVAGTGKFMLGLPGMAFLYVRAGLTADLAPQLTGWFGRTDPFSFDPHHLDYPATARRFEVGSPPVAAAYAAIAGMKLLAETSTPTIATHVAALTDRLHQELVHAGQTVASPSVAAMRGPQVALRDDDPTRLARHLAERRIVTSPRGTALRLSVHYYNNDDDIDTVVRAIAAYRG